ncbi:hypothetical protein H8B02_05100 [Bradyrhizobium sp. Pear77]|uniref:hypothetical protein n=1 Tax=Bradyrhizobium altum TaxID=1571202 RepID=UPI001E2D8CD0|nr:hypothetical protein [Bradyrhizobium altum]MCC8952863.1 hypothetical protein [Bradyrhizobium altum]
MAAPVPWAAAEAAGRWRLRRCTRDAEHRIGKLSAEEQTPPLFAAVIVAPLRLFEKRHGAREDQHANHRSRRMLPNFGQQGMDFARSIARGSDA